MPRRSTIPQLLRNVGIRVRSARRQPAPAVARPTADPATCHHMFERGRCKFCLTLSPYARATRRGAGAPRLVVGRKFMNDPVVADIIRRFHPDFYEWQERKPPAMGYWRYRSQYGQKHLPLGCVLAVARFVTARRTQAATVDAIERHLGDYTHNRWAWQLADVRPLLKPVPVRGRQKLWDLPEPTETEVLEQLAAQESKR